MAIFRFVDPNTPANVRLDLHSRSGWYLAEGLDLGRRTLNQKWLNQEGVDGGELASAWAPPVMMTVPLIMMPQANASAMEALILALNVELLRAVNGIEYLPDGLAGNSWIIDTYQSDEVSLQDGTGGSPWVRPSEGLLLTLNIIRHPDFRGRTGRIA